MKGVAADLDRWRPLFTGPPATLYLGGGTPSRLSPAAIGALIALAPGAEVSVEANPEDLTPAWLAGVLDAGVHRISLGVQSLTQRLQRVVGRAHQDPREALRRLSEAPLQSWSADLMFGLPGQTLAELDADLDGLLAFDPPHVSVYDLTIEPGTGLDRLHRRRPLDLPDEDAWCALRDRVVERLSAHGLERYEVSNYARPGHHSLHNRLYWRQRPYLGAGPSAHGFAPDGRRWVNASWAAWVAGEGPTIETPSPEQACIDALIAGLRGREGLAFESLGAGRLDPRTLESLVKHGLIEVTPSRLALTPKGFDVSNAVVRALTGTLTLPAC